MKYLIDLRYLTQAVVIAAIAVLAPLSAPAFDGDQLFNYAEALQKILYFYEAEQSGTLSPNLTFATGGGVFA